MQIEEHKSLKNYNTFRIDCKARYFVSVATITELSNVLNAKVCPNLLVLGGGSNLLLTKNIDALVLHINFKGIEIVSEDENFVYLKVMAGENWHQFVQYCIKNNYGGIENLSLIPGNVGTAPIQNIGAYGVELKDVFESCNTLSIKNLSPTNFNIKDCDFAYRNSIFKNKAKGKYIITDVTFKLTKKNHNLKIGYGAIQDKLAENNVKKPSLKSISEAVIEIRKSKLPDPSILGNSGSFFKNPIIDLNTFNIFTEKNPDAPYYKISETEYKIPAGWLIEKAGFKGKRFGDAGVHKKQALVLVNYGNATGQEIIALANKIQKEVNHLFKIKITPEVNII
ncbi:MAG: UDP-N-acetylenolpyruvoylglucosamine reductase [Flavobacterium sp.]|nr:MAG: UDP-N-acetylenolpyruvoylglucosamine reductase [Flavobacterium sp.]